MSLGATTSAPACACTTRHLARGPRASRRCRPPSRRRRASLLEDAAVAVVGVLVDADVGHDDELGHGVLHRGDRARHRAVRVVGARAGRVLRLRQAEEDDPAEPALLAAARLGGRRAHRELLDAGHRPDRARRVEHLVEEEREDQVGRRERRLADQGADRGGPPEASRSSVGNTARSLARLRAKRGVGAAFRQCEHRVCAPSWPRWPSPRVSSSCPPVEASRSRAQA